MPLFLRPYLRLHNYDYRQEIRLLRTWARLTQVVPQTSLGDRPSLLPFYHPERRWGLLFVFRGSHGSLLRSYGGNRRYQAICRSRLWCEGLSGRALAPYPQGRRARVLVYPRGPHFRSALGWVHQSTLELAGNGLVGRRDHFCLGLGDDG